ncbi:Glp-like protein [Calocera cornea HHB12733]|uniref:Glp-like protein n=1 Tax=Calocera cornea HHB12733 TaxID=1353952 RepID=A0A165E2E7_9BASI|nr:Glp-like protein [Calocera cornea HHB12733]
MKNFATLITIAATVVGVIAESHTVSFTNACGYGTPTLIQGGNVLSTGGAYTSNGPLGAAIAYLQTGSCGFNGEGCTMVELSLYNPDTNNGMISSADVTLIPPHAFSVTSGFGFYNGCDGTGNDCNAGCCPTGAFCQPTDYQAQRQCSSDNVDLAITFCD